MCAVLDCFLSETYCCDVLFVLLVTAAPLNSNQVEQPTPASGVSGKCRAFIALKLNRAWAKIPWTSIGVPVLHYGLL